MKLSVVICTHNRCALLQDTLGSMTRLVLPEGVDWELLVVNNNSTDATDDVVRSFAGRLPLRLLQESAPGKPFALNAAIAVATGDYFLFTDDDVVVDPGWLAAYHAAILQWPEAAFFGGPIQPMFEGTPPHWLQRIISQVPYCFAAIDPGPTPRPVVAPELPFGANLVIRAADQKRTPYDPRLGRRPGSWVAGEETVMLQTLLSQGATGWWVPGAAVQHFLPRSRQSLRYLKEWYRGWGQFLAISSTPPRGWRLFLGRPLWLWREVVVTRVRYHLRRPFLRPEAWIVDLQAAWTALGRFQHFARPGPSPSPQSARPAA